MKKGGRGKRVAFTTAALGVLVLLGAGIAARTWLLEEWYLHQLAAGGQAEKMAAAKRLGELKSLRAVPILIDTLAKAATEDEEDKELLTFLNEDTYLAEALGSVGSPRCPSCSRQRATRIWL